MQALGSYSWHLVDWQPVHFFSFADQLQENISNETLLTTTHAYHYSPPYNQLQLLLQG